MRLSADERLFVNPDHLQYAQDSLNEFIYSAIQRHADSGSYVYRFFIDDATIRSALGLTRAVKASVLDDYVNFFNSKGVEAVEAYGSVNVTLNLNSVSLNPQQAAALNVAMSEHRMNS